MAQEETFGCCMLLLEFVKTSQRRLQYRGDSKQNLVHVANYLLKSRLSTINPTNTHESSKIKQNKHQGMVELGKKIEILKKKIEGQRINKRERERKKGSYLE